jgi:branched-subunit amino acid transport protein
MLSETIILSVIVGACTWGFRYLPLRLSLQDLAPGGALGRFLAATGPAAIATLLAAELLPFLRRVDGPFVPLLAGLAAVVLVYLWRRSVVLATLSGSVAFGVATALMGT